MADDDILCPDEAAGPLEELTAEQTFRFSCHPGISCFNRCCHDLALPLTPYDVMRLCAHLGMDGETFLARYAAVRTFPETGFPLPFLIMDDVDGAPCPFVGPEGCTVYADRPGACRSYPLGRGTRMGRDGIEERHYLVREEHCRGFAAGPLWTPPGWQKSQGLETYNASNDRYMWLMTMVQASGRPLEASLSHLALLCLYQLEAFRGIIREKKLLAHVEMDARRACAVLTDSAATLEFGLDWLELVIFGRCPHLAPRRGDSAGT